MKWALIWPLGKEPFARLQQTTSPSRARRDSCIPDLHLAVNPSQLIFAVSRLKPCDPCCFHRTADPNVSSRSQNDLADEVRTLS